MYLIWVQSHQFPSMVEAVNPESGHILLPETQMLQLRKGRGSTDMRNSVSLYCVKE